MTPKELIHWRKTHWMPKKSGKTHSGHSQADLAEKLGASVRTVQDWEQGRYRIPRWVPLALGIKTKNKGE